MQITPLWNRILVKPIDEAQETPGGLVIPDVAAQNRMFVYAEVMGVGPGRLSSEGKLIKCTCKVGEIVMLPRRAGYPVPVPTDDGPETEMIVVVENEILAKVTDLPKATMLVDPQARRILSMLPSSRARPDVAYENMDKVAVARREGWIEPDPKTGLDGYEDADGGDA